MNKIKKTFILVFILGIVSMTYAQPEIQQSGSVNHTSGVVTGSIVDENNTPLQYASVNVKKVSDSTTVQYGVTDLEGKFILEGIPFGKYFVEIQFIGYQKSVSAPFVISKENAVYRISKYKMSNKNKEIGEVVIKAQKDMLQTNLDKTVFNIESSINATGQTAVEVLEASGLHPEAAIDLVTTPGGVTIKGLNEMEHAGFTSSVIRGLKAGAK